MTSMSSRVHLLGVALGTALALFSVGCATGNKEVRTPRYTISHPDFWNVKSVAEKDGDPTTVVIGQYGTAVIDDGIGAGESRGSNYDAVTADVEVRVYAWPAPAEVADANQAVFEMLARDGDLKLTQHLRPMEQTPECGLMKKKFKILEADVEPIDLTKRPPGHRIIVLGAKTNATLLGVVARFEIEPDYNRNCHNLSNLRVQLQNLLDGLKPVAGGGAPPAAAPNALPPATGSDAVPPAPASDAVPPGPAPASATPPPAGQ